MITRDQYFGFSYFVSLMAVLLMPVVVWFGVAVLWNYDPQKGALATSVIYGLTIYAVIAFLTSVAYMLVRKNPASYERTRIIIFLSFPQNMAPLVALAVVYFLVNTYGS